MKGEKRELVGIVDIVVPVLFGIVGLAILSWLVVISIEFVRSNRRARDIMSVVLAPAPDKAELENSSLPVKFVFGGILPIIFWLLILLPMIIFPIILVIFPLLGIPWSYLLPPTP